MAYFWFIMTVLFLELPGFGFGLAGFFFLGFGVGLNSMVIIIFMGYLLAPPDIMYYTLFSV